MLRTLLAAALLLSPVVLGACDPPGKGPKAERGYDRSAPVIAALEQYRSQRGEYPASLREMVPAFLADSALRVPDRPGETYPLEYTRLPEGYALEFRYTGPGMNDCTYRPGVKKWDCGGRF